MTHENENADVPHAPNTDANVTDAPRVLPDIAVTKSVERNRAKRNGTKRTPIAAPKFAMPTLARVLPNNQFALADLARELNIDPKRARGKFRKLRDMKHPALMAIKSRRDNATWIFAKSDRERVTKLLRTPIAALPTK